MHRQSAVRSRRGRGRRGQQSEAEEAGAGGASSQKQKRQGQEASSQKQKRQGQEASSQQQKRQGQEGPAVSSLCPTEAIQGTPAHLPLPLAPDAAALTGEKRAGITSPRPKLRLDTHPGRSQLVQLGLVLRRRSPLCVELVLVPGLDPAAVRLQPAVERLERALRARGGVRKGSSSF